MKTTFKKSVLAFLTCVLALAFALTGSQFLGYRQLCGF